MNSSSAMSLFALGRGSLSVPCQGVLRCFLLSEIKEKTPNVNLASGYIYKVDTMVIGRRLRS